MNDILGTVITSLINNFAPIAISALTGWVAMQYNNFLKQKQEQIKISNQNEVLKNATSEALDKIKITDSVLDFMNKKALEGVKIAEEKAFQAWKDNSRKELTGVEKKDIATSYVEQAVKSVSQDKNIVNLVPAIVENVIASNRGVLDDMFNNLKKNFVLFSGSVPENSRDPFAVPAPNTTPTSK